jgi:hypothetical protein
MRIRSLVLSSLAAAACCLAPAVRAYGAGGSGGSVASDAGLGTGTGGGDPGCTVASEEQSGTTCVACDTSIGLCSEQLGSDYAYICKSTASAEIWCNGPARQQASDNNVACAVSVPGAAGDGVAAACALVAAALVVGVRRRRR